MVTAAGAVAAAVFFGGLWGFVFWAFGFAVGFVGASAMAAVEAVAGETLGLGLGVAAGLGVSAVGLRVGL